MVYLEINSVVMSSVDEQEFSSQFQSSKHRKVDRLVQQRLSASKQAFKNCYQVEIRQFDRYIQQQQPVNQQERNVQLISSRLIEHYPYAAEKILSDFFKLKMPHLPLSWNLYKQKLIDYLKMDIPQNRIRKIKLKDLQSFRQLFIKNIKFPLKWKQPRKGRNLSQLNQLENLFSDLTENVEKGTESSKLNQLEYKAKTEEIQLSQTQTLSHPIQNLICLSQQQLLPKNIQDLMTELDLVELRCFQHHQLTLYAIENMKLQIMADIGRQINQNLTH